MADAGADQRELQDLLKFLSLDQYFPEKLTSDRLYEVTELSIRETEHVTPESISRIFINRLTRNNYKARHLKTCEDVSKTKSTGYLQRRRQGKSDNLTQFHPLDIMVAVFLCCDPLAKQDLVMFMWACKISVPLILNGPFTYPVVYQWPLRAIVAQWQVHGNTSATEHSLFTYPMQKIGFIRIGDLQESKSALLNGIIGGPEKTHPMFFHRDMYGSQKRRSMLVEGLVETGWFLPKGETTDRFSTSKLFANLRGDASSFTQQLDTILQTMDLILVISHTRYLSPKCSTLCDVVQKGKPVLLILTDTVIDDEGDSAIEYMISQMTDCIEDRFEILPLEDRRLADKLDYICEHIKLRAREDPGSYASLEETIRSSKIKMKIDETNDEHIKKCARYITSKVNTKMGEGERTDILPLQGEIWKNWTETESKTHTLESFIHVDTNGGISSFISSLEMQKVQLRKQQYELVRNMHPVMLFFMKCLEHLRPKTLKIFLRALKLGLNEVSCSIHKPYYECYKRILEAKRNANGEEIINLNSQLEKLDQEKAVVSFGLEHFVRELGQIYEACINEGKYNLKVTLSSTCEIPFMRIPYFAVRILLAGFPIELMDGDAGFVPEIWMARVMECLNEMLGKSTRLHIISVLGIQSSGKSTLLNTLFGLQFAVSAGRCTKGVFMQLVKVEETMRSRFNVDYFVAIDTEGLRASHASTKFDNELSCLAIGLADLTIVNLMGENAKYLEENLPVVVHAFLRMDMVGLKPQCILVHQNVDKTNKDKLMEQNRLLEKVLDELTSRACDMEGIQHKRFKEIIHFDVCDNTYYIPSLLEGDQPMGPVSVGYSKECNSLRNNIIRRSEQSSRNQTIAEFSTHLNNLWTAIKTDNFVFNFKSTAETQSSMELDEEYSIIYRKLLETISKFEEKALSLAKNALPSQKADIVKSLKQDISTAGKDHKQKLLDYIEAPNKTYAKFCIQWKDDTLTRFDKHIKDATVDSIDQVEKVFAKKDNKMRLDSDDKANCVDESELDDIVSVQLRNARPTDSVGIIVNRSWTQWYCEREKVNIVPQANVDTMHIKRDVETFLVEQFDSEKKKLEIALGKTDASAEYDLQSFVIQDKHFSGFDFAKWNIRNKRNKSDAEQIVNVIISYTKAEIDRISATGIHYTKTTSHKILLQVKAVLERHKGKFTKYFKIDVVTHVAKYLVSALSDLYRREQRADEMARIKSLKTYVDSLIRSKIDKQQKDIVHTMFTEQIADLVYKETIHQTIANIYLRQQSSLTEFLARSKQIWVDELLGRAISDYDYDLIELYLTDPESAVTHMLVKCIATEHIQRDARSDFYRQLRIYRYELETIRTCSEMNIRDLIVNSFQNADLSVQSVSSIKIVDVDISKLQRDILHSIDNVDEDKLTKQLEETIQKHNRVIKLEMANNYLKKLGCLEKCPFCNEMCMYDNENHVGPHQAARHRPVGYSNLELVESREVVSDVCSTLVRSNCVFRQGDSVIPFKQYRKIYPNWKISEHTRKDASLLWKWYFASCLHDKTCKLKVPKAWGYIPRERVIHSLISPSLCSSSTTV